MEVIKNIQKNLAASDDKKRQNIINNLIVKLLLECSSEEEAVDMFLWKLADLDQPVNYGEQLVFRALFRMFRGYCEISVNNREQAFRLLNIPRDKLNYPGKEIMKNAKLSYWKNFYNVSNMNDFVKRARRIGAQKKAFTFLCNEFNLNCR